MTEQSVFLSTRQNHPFTLTFINFFILLYVSSSFIMHTIPLCTGGYLGFSILPMNTSACRLEHLVLKPLNFQLVDNLLNLLSPNCSKIQRSLNTVRAGELMWVPLETQLRLVSSLTFTHSMVSCLAGIDQRCSYWVETFNNIALQTSMSDNYYRSEQPAVPDKLHSWLWPDSSF